MAHRLLTAARRLDRLLQKVKKTGSVDPNVVSEVFLLGNFTFCYKYYISFQELRKLSLVVITVTRGVCNIFCRRKSGK